MEGGSITALYEDEREREPGAGVHRCNIDRRLGQQACPIACSPAFGAVRVYRKRRNKRESCALLAGPRRELSRPRKTKLERITAQTTTLERT